MLPTNEGTRDVCGLLFSVLVETDRGEPLFAGKERKERNHPWSAAAVPPRKRWFLKSPRLFCVFGGKTGGFRAGETETTVRNPCSAAVVIGPSPLCKQIFSGGGSSWAGRRPVSAGHPPNSQTGLTLQQWDRPKVRSFSLSLRPCYRHQRRKEQMMMTASPSSAP